MPEYDFYIPHLTNLIIILSPPPPHTPQAVGHCDGSYTDTEMFKSTTSSKDGQTTSVTHFVNKR